MRHLFDCNSSPKDHKKTGKQTGKRRSLALIHLIDTDD
jgi:hypothetical protein